VEFVDALIQQPSRQVGSPRDGWQRELESELDGEPDHGFAMSAPGAQGDRDGSGKSLPRLYLWIYIVWVGSKACTTVRVTT